MIRIIYKLLIVLILILSSGIILTTDANAGGKVEIINFSQSIIAGNEFEVGFKAEGLDINSEYNIKGLGGENFTEVDTWNNDWLQQNAAWVSMPTFLSNDGSPSGTLKLRFDSTSSGTKDLKVRIKKSGSDSSNIDSPTVSVSVTAATPSPTPVTTTQPTKTPSPTSVPTLSPTSTPSPTQKPTPKPSAGSTPEVLAENTFYSDTASLSPSPTPAASETKKFPFLALVLIFAGVILIALTIFPGLPKKDTIASCVKK